MAGILDESKISGQNEMKSRILIFVCVIFFLLGMTIINYRYAVQNPGGTDFMIRWLGTRLLITEGLNPYSEQATGEIQEMFYGRFADRSEDQLLFVYPLYSVWIFAPYALIPDYDLARAAWMTTLELSIILITAASLSISRWSVKPAMLALLLTFALLWYYGLRSIINGNIAVLVGLFIVLAFWAMHTGRDEIAGILLAFSTVKPPVVVLVLVFVLLWAFSVKRWKLIWSFLGSMILLTASMMLIVPNWVGLNFEQVLAYPGYAPPGTPRAVFAEWMPEFGNLLGWISMVLLAVLMVWEWRQAWGKNFEHLFWTVYLTLVVTNLIGVQTATENYMAMFPALILVFALWSAHGSRLGRGLVLISMFILFFGVWWLFFATLQQGGPQPMQGLLMYFPLPVFLMIGLYSVRGIAVNTGDVFGPMKPADETWLPS